MPMWMGMRMCVRMRMRLRACVPVMPLLVFVTV
jgi:hypothetical protein